MEDLIGQSLGQYHIIERLGEGGMARVYKAESQLEPARYVALKVIRSDRHGHETLTQVERLEQEAMAAAGLSHPNIVSVHDFGRFGDVTFLVMDLIEGITLKAGLKQRQADNRPFSLAEIGNIFNSLAGAVDYAHRQGIIHRDLKPANIMLTYDNQIMLTDFGIAHLTFLPGQATTALLGTPAYMSPEQVSGDPVDACSDIYALGVILFEVVIGYPPFAINHHWDVFKHINKPVPRPSTLKPDLPDAVEQVILKAMHKNPAERFGTATGLARALAAASDGSL